MVGMNRGSHWGVTPQSSIQAEAERRGLDVVVGECLSLLGGEEAPPSVLQYLAGPAAWPHIDDPDRVDAYWVRVWALRGLLWAWHPRATDAVISCLGDESWRVREMAAKVAARHHLLDAVAALAERRHDRITRVRRAADRALARLTEDT